MCLASAPQHACMRAYTHAHARVHTHKKRHSLPPKHQFPTHMYTLKHTVFTLFISQDLTQLSTHHLHLYSTLPTVYNPTLDVFSL